MSRRLLPRLSVFALLGAILAAPLPAASQTKNVEWTSGSPGGAWFTQTTGVSTLVMEAVPSVNIRVVPGGGKDNPSRIQAGLSQIGMGIDFLSAAALKGEEPYKQKHDKLRTLGSSGVDVYYMVYVPVEEKRSLAELLSDPKLTIGVTSQATSEHLTLQRALEFYGNSFAKIRQGGGKVVISAYGELIQGFNDNQFDILWTAGEIPSGLASQIIDGRRKVKFVSFSDALQKNLTEKYGYSTGVIKAGTFPELQSSDISVSAMGNLYLVSADLPDDFVYAMTKAIISNRPRLANIYQAMSRYDPATAWKMQPVPLHPGAEKAFREGGFMK
jgi:TRAP transporter TAXI family solute receptor